MGTAAALAVYGVLLAAAAALVWRRPVLALYAFLVGVAVNNAAMAALYGAGLRGLPLTAVTSWKEVLLLVALARVAVDASRARRLPFRPGAADWLALAFALLVALYALVPQSALDGHATRKAVVLGARHDLVPVGAFFLGRALALRGRDLVRLAWTLLGAAAAVAVLGIVDLYAVPISWWRRSAVVPYFHDQLGYDFHGSGGLPENFVFNTGSEEHFVRRLVSVFLSPLGSAYMLVVALLVGAALLRRRAALALTAVCAVGLLYTFTRSALLVTAGALCVLAYALRRWWPIAAAAAVVALSVVWISEYPSFGPQGKWTKADLAYQREVAKTKGPQGSAFNDSSTREHWEVLREGARTVLHHPQGFGVGNAGQSAFRTDVPLKAGESNYTELGVETGLLGAILWLAWGLAVLVGLVRAGRRGSAAAGWAAAFAAMLALAIQTDVIGDPWVAYCVWAFGGTLLAAPVRELRDESVPIRAQPAINPGSAPTLGA